MRIPGFITFNGSTSGGQNFRHRSVIRNHEGVTMALPKGPSSSIEDFCGEVALRDEMTAVIVCDKYGDWSESCQSAQRAAMGSYDFCVNYYYGKM